MSSRDIHEARRGVGSGIAFVVTGPSGAGKSSFIRAGLLPAMPAGWRSALCHPGSAPHLALGRVLAPELAGDTEAMTEMLRFEDPDVAVALFARWRGQHDEVLLIVDQFEELLTLNPRCAVTALYRRPME